MFVLLNRRKALLNIFQWKLFRCGLEKAAPVIFGILFAFILATKVLSRMIRCTVFPSRYLPAQN